VPPLRERRDDILLLAESLLSRVRPGRQFELSGAARRALVAYDYPGNVRELRNIVERASLLVADDRIEREHLPAEVVGERSESRPQTGKDKPPSALRTIERESLAQAMVDYRGNRRELAQALGLSERTLYRKLRQYGLGRAASERGQ
jgi:DNA-binding NtrC family response regulator